MADKNMPENNKSDILVILENIDQILKCYTKMVNGYARNIQEVAIAVEAMTLAQKMRLAAERWEHKLPFKEACDVDFKEWEKRMEYWCDFIAGEDNIKGNYDDIRYFIPETDFFIDQYYYGIFLESIDKIAEMKDSFSPFYMIKDAEIFYDKILEYRDMFDCIVTLRNKIDKNAVAALFLGIPAEDKYMFSLEQLKIMRHVMDKEDSDSIEWITKSDDAACNSGGIGYALYVLSLALHYSEKVLLNSNDSAFKDLYERLSVAYFDDLIKDAKGDFQKWLNSTPKKKRLVMMKKKLEKEKTKFLSGKWKEGLENYFDIDDIESVLEGIDAGKFIFRYRNDLTLEEVGKIIAQYHKIACFHSAIHDMENKENDVTPVIPENQAQEEKSMNLPIIFNPIIREDAKATNMIVEALRELALTTGNKSKKISGGKTWGHVKTSLDILGYIEKNCLGSDFGRAIEDICPGTICKNVEQALKRYNINMHDKNRDKTHDENIISDIGKVFDKLKCYLVTHYPQKFSKG